MTIRRITTFLIFLFTSQVAISQQKETDVKSINLKESQLAAPMYLPPPDDGGGGGTGGGGTGGGGGGSTSPPPTPSTTISTSYYCGSTRVKRNATPPSYVRWYWQTVSYGTSWSYGYGSTYTFSSTRHVYLRSYDTRTLKWGGYKYVGYMRVNPNNLNAGNTSGAKTICYGASAGTLGNSSSASGGLSSYSYQWQVSSNNSSWSNISGATGTTYSPGNLTSTRYYRRRVTSCGYTKYAASEKVTVRANLSAGSIGNAQTVCYNGNPSTLTNTSSASGGATRTYQWQKSTTSSSSGFSNISGATGSTYDPPALTQTTWYRRRVTSSSGCGTKYTNVIGIGVRSNLNAGSIGNAQTLCYNGDPSTLSNTTSASGGATRTYQWQKSTTSSSSGFSDISGASSSTYDPPALSETTWYRRRVTSTSGCGTQYTNVVQVSIYETLSAGSIGNAQTMCYNENPSSLTSTASASGGTSRVYQWQKSTTSSTNGFIDIGGESSNTYDPPSLTQTTWYRRKVTSGSGCGTKYTNVIQISVFDELSPGIITNPQALCNGGDPGVLGSDLASSGGGSTTYQWQQSTTSSSEGFSDITGAANSTYDPANLNQTTWYKRKVTSADGCGTKYSNTLQITIYEDLQAGTIDNAQVICYNGDPEAIQSAIDASGGTGLVYQWQASITGATEGFSDIAGATNSDYDPLNLSDTTWFRRKVSSGAGCGVLYSNSVEVSVYEDLLPGTVGNSQTLCNLSDPTVLTNTASASGGISNTYQWEHSTVSESSGFTDIPGAIDEFFDPPVLTQTTWYRRKATAGYGCGIATTEPVEINIAQVVEAGTIANDQSVCEGILPNDLTGSVPTGGMGTYMTQWESSADNESWSVLEGETHADLSFTSFGQSTYYRRVVSNSCGSDVSNTVLVSFKPLPDAGIIEADQQTCLELAPATIIGTDFSAIPSTTYQWQSSVDEVEWNDIVGETNTNYNPPAQTQSYRRAVTHDGCIAYSVPKRIEAIQCFADAGEDQQALNNDDPFALIGTPVGGSWSGYGVSDGMFYPQVAGVGKHELTYSYSSVIGGESEDKMIVQVDFNEMTDTFMSNYIFQYKYDKYDRMIEKQVPGAGWVYMVYDDRDRLVMTQDGNQRPDKEWVFTKYDQLNRPVLTGIYTHGSEIDQAAMQGVVDQFYADAAANTTLGERVDEWYEERGSAVHGYTNKSFPSVSSKDEYLTVTYYDNYDFSTDGHWGLGDFTSENQAKTYVTGAKVRVDLPDGSYDWNELVTLYDSRYRVASSVSKDYQDNYDSLVNEYYSLVHPLVVKTTHYHESALTNAADTITKVFDYDHADRLMSVSHQINSDPAVVILANEYNELGELIKKKLNDEGGGNFSQEVDYQYNIRGWLTKINDPVTPDPEDYFAMQLKYDEAGQYNGNIGATAWKNPFETTANEYDYTYDPVNRLKSAAYNSGAFSVPNIDYDANGNILALERKGLDDTGSTTDWDDLDYKYVGNQLTKVDDSGSADLGFKDGASASTEYEYDANGNMISDANKGIESIEYNHLNLPTVVTLSNVEGSGNNGRIEYIYDAAGTKLAQIVYEDGTQTKRTDYQGAFIYEDSVLQFIQHEEGRIVYETDVNGEFVEYEYQYHLKDHLGNVRTTFKEEGDIEGSFASFEQAKQSEESDYFIGYDNMVKIDAELFDHTKNPEGSHSSIRLNGFVSPDSTVNESIGLAKSLKVKPGDVIDMKVYAKYFLQSESSGWTGTLNTIATNIAGNVGGIVVDGGGLGLDTHPFVDWTEKASPTAAPKAYMNYMVFDEYFNLIDEKTGFKQISESAKENGSGVEHEKLEHSITISQSGYVYIYLSNEEDTPIDVFFDDFTVTQNHTPIVSKDDYYPFGLTFASYNRPASVDQRFKYNGKELVSDLGFGLIDYQARWYDPALGRWHSIDPAADLMRRHSPYNYAFDNPIMFIDPDGMIPMLTDDKLTSTNPNSSLSIHEQKIDQHHKDQPISIKVDDQAERPKDNGTAGTTYTATITVEHSDGRNDTYKGSSHPNSTSETDNSAGAKTVAEGTHNFSNKFGHDGGNQKGLNLGQGEVSKHSQRTVPGIDKNGEKTTVINANAHSGTSDNGNYNSRGSLGCITVCPTDVERFNSNFDWSGGNTGNSHGTITISRTNTSMKKTAEFQQQKYVEYKNQLKGIY
ncbi:MAG: RHS repeat-associated core domain-containing protein [Reichenbachiella sp.]|uniref:RHS repeat-associated core domain-containing protein n=1 Tax=Reichenbachiella sp. TaxID=2184521 RepID=UPI002965DFA6|nr:RHS repeat-associated core domain-containing protein [Reichenbachiella sp.]MDW3209197.1 RHS repeat-associated core domain-containing protein [Reichenbachiella sp.]